MEEKTPVTAQSEQYAESQGTFDERWDRYCRLRDTACQMVIFGALENQALPFSRSPLRQSQPDEGAAVSVSEAADPFNSLLRDVWWVCCDADMASAADCVAVEPAATTSGAGGGEDSTNGQSASDRSFSQSDACGREAPCQPEHAGNCEGESAPSAVVHPGAAWRLDASHGVAPAPHRPKLTGTARKEFSADSDTPVLSYRVDERAEALSPPHFATTDAAATAAPLFPLEDAYRQLRDHLFPVSDERPQAVAWLGAAGVEDGASVLVALAKALAERGSANRVLLIDADFEMFALSRRFKRPGSAGLGDVVAGKRPWRQTVLPSALAQIDILPCGSLCDRPLATLNGAYWLRLLAELKDAYRYILIDAGTPDQPSLAPLLQVVDSTYMLVEFDRTSRADVAATVGQLRRWGVANLATVMVGLPANELVA